MNIFRAMDISASALTAQRFRMDIIGENIANQYTTRTAEGGVYRRKNVVFEERPLNNGSAITTREAVSGSFRDMFRSAAYGNAPVEHHYDDSRNFAVSNEPWNQRYGGKNNGPYGGVRVVDVVESDQPFKIVYDPDHPDADEEGYVTYPNVDIESEMINFISATRSYEANITAINNFKNIAMKALDIGR